MDDQTTRAGDPLAADASNDTEHDTEIALNGVAALEPAETPEVPAIALAETAEGLEPTPPPETPAEPAPSAPVEASAPARVGGNGGGRGGRGSGGGRGGYGGSGSDMAALLAESEQQFRQLKYGDVLEGRIMRKDPDELLVDIGSKSEGVIPMSEVSSLTPAELQALEIGDEVLVSVVQTENQEGHVVLSLDKARQERSWRNLQRKFEGGELLEAEVTGYNKGGLLVNLEGVRGFVPASQVSGLSSGGNEAVKQSELSRYTGQTLPLKIIEINRNRNRLILSERQAAQEQRDIRKEQLLSELQPGQVRDGVVSSICDFGAFVDIGGADGLIHLSELSWSRVNHPSEVLRVGAPVQVYVMSVDEKDRKIALSLKRTQPEPWSTVMDRYHLGQLVRGTITQLTDFGAFARLEDGIEGLIHVSELAEGRVTHPRNVVQEGMALTLRVIRIDPQRRRMGLSLKRAMEAQEGDTLPPQEPLPNMPPRTSSEPPAEGGERPAGGGGERPAGERPPMSGGRPPERGGRGPERGGRGPERGGRGRGDQDAEPAPPMSAQPEMTTSMAAALSAAMEAQAEAQADAPAEASTAPQAEATVAPPAPAPAEAAAPVEVEPPAEAPALAEMEPPAEAPAASQVAAAAPVEVEPPAEALAASQVAAAAPAEVEPLAAAPAASQVAAAAPAEVEAPAAPQAEAAAPTELEPPAEAPTASQAETPAPAEVEPLAGAPAAPPPETPATAQAEAPATPALPAPGESEVEPEAGPGAYIERDAESSGTASALADDTAPAKPDATEDEDTRTAT